MPPAIPRERTGRQQLSAIAGPPLAAAPQSLESQAFAARIRHGSPRLLAQPDDTLLGELFFATLMCGPGPTWAVGAQHRGRWQPVAGPGAGHRDRPYRSACASNGGSSSARAGRAGHPLHLLGGQPLQHAAALVLAAPRPGALADNKPRAEVLAWAPRGLRERIDKAGKARKAAVSRKGSSTPCSVLHLPAGDELEFSLPRLHRQRRRADQRGCRVGPQLRAGPVAPAGLRARDEDLHVFRLLREGQPSVLAAMAGPIWRGRWTGLPLEAAMATGRCYLQTPVRRSGAAPKAGVAPVRPP